MSTEAPVVETNNVIPVDGGINTELPVDEVVIDTQVEEVIDPVEDTPVVKEEKIEKRFSEVTKRANEAEKRAQETDRRLTLALEALERAVPKQAPVIEVPVVEDVEPEPPEFIDPEQYQRDMATYTKEVASRLVRQQMKDAEAEARIRVQAESQQQAQLVQQQAWAKRREAAMTEMPDYAEVAERPDVAITQAMAVAIASDDLGPKLAYHLGKNPDLAEKISNMPVPLQLMELGMLKAQLSLPKPVAVSKAPSPIRPLSGSVNPQVKSVDEMSMEEYAANRKKSH